MTETTSPLFYHAHEHLIERCKGRMRCMRVCPTRAIRVRNGKVSFLQDLCVDCGECMNACPEEAFTPISDGIEDFSVFKYKIALPSPVLYTQFGVDAHPGIVTQALKNIGFDEVVDISEMNDELSFALSHHLNTNPDARPLISSFCPTIVRLIQVSYPNLVNLVTPFDVPREIVANKIKDTYPKKLGLNKEDIGVIYITPCPAKVVSIKQPAEKEQSWIDCAIPIKDIYNILLPEILELQKTRAVDEKKMAHHGTGWVVIGHITRDVGAERWISVAGLDHVKMIFDDIENSKLRNIDLIEALACRQGCVGGTFCVENPYIARSTSIKFERKYSSEKSFNKETVLNKYDKGKYFMQRPLLPRPTRSLHRDISSSIKRLRQKERILKKLPMNDCGLCGAPTCDAFADDCTHGEADLTDCIFFTKKIKQ